MSIDARDLHREKAVELFKKHKFIKLEWPTGSGKGRTLLDCINADDSGLTWWILCPDTLQVENMKKEVIKWGYDHLLDSGKIADIICYASFKTCTGMRGNLGINEAHHLSKLKEDIAQTIDYKCIVADSATIPLQVHRRLNKLGNFYDYKITPSQAIEEGMIPEPKIYIKTTILDNETKSFLVGPKSKQWKVTQKKYIQNFDDNIKYWKDRQTKERLQGKNADWIDNKIIKIGLNRKKAIAETKTNDITELINKIGDRRFICFCGSVDQTEILGPGMAINSRHKKSDNIETLRRFNTGEINQLYMNKMGKEGLNLTDIEVVIIAQLGSGNDEGLSFVQQVGRGLRSEVPEIYVFMAKGSKDEEFVRANISSFDKKYVEWLS